MRLVHLPTHWTIALDVAAWFVIHMAVVVGMLSLPDGRFDPDAWLYRGRRFESDGRFYERWLGVRRWKDALPDGAEWLRWRGFPKRRLQERSRGYYRRFLRETCRAELTHWLTFLCAPLFFLWNPPWVGWLMIGYAAAENLPLIAAQRYNRPRFRRILARAARPTLPHGVGPEPVGLVR